MGCKVISEPSPLHVRLAINQNKGALKVLAEDLPATLKASGLPAPDKARIQALNAKAQQAIQAYIQRLEAIDKEQAASGKGRSFRLGQPLYDAKFRYDIQATVDAKTLHERALAQKAALHERMSGIADQLWPQLFPGQVQPADRLEKIAKVIDKLSERHVKREQYIDEITVAHGMTGAPVQYGLLDNARRRRLGIGVGEYRQQMAELFAPFSKVAARSWREKRSDWAPSSSRRVTSASDICPPASAEATSARAEAAPTTRAISSRARWADLRSTGRPCRSTGNSRAAASSPTKLATSRCSSPVVLIPRLPGAIHRRGEVRTVRAAIRP